MINLWAFFKRRRGDCAKSKISTFPFGMMSTREERRKRERDRGNYVEWEVDHGRFSFNVTFRSGWFSTFFFLFNFTMSFFLLLNDDVAIFPSPKFIDFFFNIKIYKSLVRKIMTSRNFHKWHWIKISMNHFILNPKAQYCLLLIIFIIT